MNRFVRSALACLVMAIGALPLAPVQAQDKYPSRSIRIVVPYVAGGVGDVVARILSTPLGEVLGQPVIVENRPGGDAAMGTEYAARTPPDGYTILQVSTPQAVNMVLKENVRYDLLRDFVPVARVASTTLVLTTSVNAPGRSVADLVAAGKARPGGLTFGSGAVGSLGHLSGELFKRAANISALHVPYKGNAAVIPDLIGGRLDFFFATQPEALQGVSGGHLRALAVTATQRVAAFPGVPTMIEAGFPNFDPSSNYGYMVPANTPPAVVVQLYEAIARVVNTPAVQERFQTLGLTSALADPQAWGASVKNDIYRWGQVIKAANIRAD
ncbi:tripartite tricarboxylate transporter substrate binding protein [Xylophilus sp. GOD-11R]|uniref:Bug family tripartite tricarboxylate transporter substrate binding protein n=1 Tax=Xylophilus sp. GOD-11R TaxID=3089814 RepID=UPI00298C203F|nr:tripartite tricarboxylate transporter substrate binding protein [Xylophilus sp. GOD-11R]WPB55897.1 tripartite tricarboxylate transporter substrate binding protein [Xylophilus sp. GOD-11R]